MSATPNHSNPVDILRKLTEFPTYEKSGMQDCAEFLATEAQRSGFKVDVDKLNNVFAEKIYQGGEGAFLINCHFDTVPSTPRWTKDPLRASLEGDRLYGLGTSDDKGSAASILHILAKLKTCRFRKLEVLFSNYEDNNTVFEGETWLGTPYFLRHHRLESQSGVNVEGTVEKGRLMVSLGCGGRVGFRVTTIGKEAHSSDPRKGRNAIYDMVRVVEALRKLPPVRMTVDGHEAYTELNVSMIRGGIAMNIVPAECEITCERRVLPNEDWADVKRQVEGALAAVKDVEFRVSYMSPQKSYLIPRDHPAVTLATESTRQALGYSPEFKVESGRTDSTYFNEAGIKTVIIGPGEVAHIADEYINTKRLEEFTQVLYSMLTRGN
ncbi:MAG TPA: M20/M25/M40 family metallo-hydrolase [Candidatus Dormibacteraeota bacterium]|nr:M20/M25/M40 family metallo-hydrolase [Candidatus Dormibacteraeota bacterium]